MIGWILKVLFGIVVEISCCVFLVFVLLVNYFYEDINHQSQIVFLVWRKQKNYDYFFQKGYAGICNRLSLSFRIQYTNTPSDCSRPEVSTIIPFPSRAKGEGVARNFQLSRGRIFPRFTIISCGFERDHCDNHINSNSGNKKGWQFCFGA